MAGKPLKQARIPRAKSSAVRPLAVNAAGRSEILSPTVREPAAALVIARSIEEDIVLGRRHPRERLVEQDLCDLFDTHRGDVRSALFELEKKGLVERIPNRGAMVRGLTPSEGLEIYAVREEPEVMAGRIQDRYPKDRAQWIPNGVWAELRKFYYEIAQANHPGALDALMELAPLSNVLFGSDYPLRPASEVVEGLTGYKPFTDAQRRTINREKLQLDELQNQLANENSLRFKVFTRYSQLLKARSSTSAFHPHGTQTILDLHPAVFAIERISPNGDSRALCLHNVSQGTISFSTKYEAATDLFTGQTIRISRITLEPYQVLWFVSPVLSETRLMKEP